MPVHVSSEIGRLREVLVHTPGPELLAVTPSTREDYLYDDIIDVETARKEHGRFVAILERFATVHHVTDLLTEVVANREVRDLLCRETMDIVPLEPLARELNELPDASLVRLLIEGHEEEPGPLARTLNERGLEQPARNSHLVGANSSRLIAIEERTRKHRYGGSGTGPACAWVTSPWAS